MKTRNILGLGALATVAGATVFLARESAAVTVAQAAELPTVQAQAASDDGKEVYALDIFQPWDDAQHRMIVFAGASVTGSGLASLSKMRRPDAGAGNQPLTVTGETYKCTATIHVQDWAAVRMKTDVTLTVERKH